MKKFALVTILATVIALTFGSVAYANFGPHGGYAQDTDACAGCHRAHTSASSVTWKRAGWAGGMPDENAEGRSALLVSSATTMSQFCYACHGDGAPGASTNVLTGVFDAGPSGAVGQLEGDSNGGVGVIYRTNSVAGAGLNGGSFSGTSMHDMDQGAATDPIWGKGNSAPTGTNFTCTDCHDPHGSSNYRLLRDQLGTNRVGGYDNGTDDPQPWVISDEEGYPVNGWKKHQDGADQMALYKPNYTNAEYGYIGEAADYAAGEIKSMSSWCAGCHEAYDVRDDTKVAATYDYGDAEAAKSDPSVTMGARARHRHPVNMPATGGGLTVQPVVSTVLPLEVSKNRLGQHRGNWNLEDIVGCLTCHRAHGSSATMTGWAEAALDTSATAVVTWFPVLDPQPGVGGVNPNQSAALLRADNRGVCERCHNK